MAKKDFCVPEDFTVNIPYPKFLKLMETVNNFEAIEQRMTRLEDRMTGLYGIYTEVLEKLGEIKELL